ncbi:hypothetical protein B9Z55_003128 [Caenorhabditis nigoni]|nr:hypothetical protein B9Z55_003128 [Caenorhabditis nigoni]
MNNKDLDVFLQQWKTRGAFPNLRWLAIRSRKIDNESPILEMIPPIIFSENPKIKVSIRNYSDDAIVDGVRVTNDDGKEGWLKVNVGDFPMLKLLGYFILKLFIELTKWEDE